MRSAEAAKTTSAMIEGSVNNARSGVAIAAEVAGSLASIVAMSERVNALIGEIAAASGEQANGIGQVNTAVSQMDQVTQSNAASAEECAAAAEQLSSQAEQLSGVVGQLVALVGGAAVAGAASRSPSVRATAKPRSCAKPHGGPRTAPPAATPFDADGNFGAFRRAA